MTDWISMAAIKPFIDSCTWTFAKTMARIPHEYIVREKVKAEDFDRLAEFIKNNSVPEKFFKKTYYYSYIGSYKYWVIENIINRAFVGKPNV